MFEVHLFVQTDKSSKVALKFTPDEQMVVRGLDLAKGVMAYWKIKMADGNTKFTKTGKNFINCIIKTNNYLHLRNFETIIFLSFFLKVSMFVIDFRDLSNVFQIVVALYKKVRWPLAVRYLGM